MKPPPARPAAGAAPLQRYLERYAESETAAALNLDTGWQDQVLVIPCYDEAPDFLEDLLPERVGDTLVIAVVNAPDNAPADARARTARLLQALRGASPQRLSLTPYSRGRNVWLLVVDRATDQRLIPRRQGVGLARKIGADIALGLIAARRIRRPWIFATDADVTLPEDYLHTPMPASGAALFPFRHVARDPALQRRADLYELHLRYYVNGLARAGSPYAYHTLGSTMAIHARAYAAVRGYPRRNAGEDFYLLNKLAKVDGIHPLGAPVLTIQARPSSRVPFGTGPALEKIPRSGRDYLSYAPAGFERLRAVQEAMAAVVAGEPWRASPEADAILNDLGFFPALHNAQRQQRRPDTLRKALHQWFDGFRTLRFIHECRRFHPDEPLLATLASMFGPPPGRQMPASVASPRHYLERLRAMESRHPLGVR